MERRRTALVGTYGPRTSDEMLRVLAAPAAEACDLVELRLDFLPDAGDRLAELIDASPAPVIATCRRESDPRRRACPPSHQ